MRTATFKHEDLFSNIQSEKRGEGPRTRKNRGRRPWHPWSV